MRLESISLKHVGGLTGEVSIGPLDAGLNVLAAGNEAGKSTLLMATARALFDRHNVTGDSIAALQPVGTSLAPEVTVTFEAAQGRFQVFKRFLHSASAELREFKDGEWQPIADSDAADVRLLELVAGARAGRGASKPEHWGMLRHLWARQSELTSWPDFQDDTGERVRTCLAGVEIDGVVEQLIGSFESTADEQYTSTGRLKKNGPLAVLHETIAEQEEALDDLRATIWRMDSQQQELATHRETLAVCRSSKTDADQKVLDLTAMRRDIELLRKDLERFNDAYAAAERQLTAVDADKVALSKGTDALADADTRQKELAGAGASVQQKGAELQVSLSELRKQLKEQQAAVGDTRNREARLRDIAALVQHENDVAGLTKAFDRAIGLDQQLASLREQRAELPDIDKRKIKNLRSLEESERELCIRAEAIGLRVRITVDEDAELKLSRDEAGAELLKISGSQTEDVRAVRAVALDIPNWGRIDVASGAEEAATLEAEVAKQRGALDEALGSLNVNSVKNAVEVSEQGAAIDRELKTVTGVLDALLEDWESIGVLKGTLDRAKGDVAQLSKRLRLSKDERALTAADLDADLSAVQDELRSMDRGVKTLEREVEKNEKSLAAIDKERADRAAALDDLGKELAGLNARIKTILDRYPNGIDKAEEEAQAAFVAAKAERAVAMGKLPDDWDRIEARHERALKAASQVAGEYDALNQNISALEAVLKESGSQGLYSKETQLIEALESDRKRAQGMRSKALAARLLAGLLDYRKKASVRTVLAPLEDQLSGAFAELTGNHSRRIFLDEDLHISGIGRNRDEAITFAQLSQGAKEQLLLALRAAVALELSKEEPQILILDDVLVNTDPVRQERVLDYLQQISTDVQVLILTCHPDMYRGVGQAVGLDVGVPS